MNAEMAINYLLRWLTKYLSVQMACYCLLISPKIVKQKHILGICNVLIVYLTFVHSQNSVLIFVLEMVSAWGVLATVLIIIPDLIVRFPQKTMLKRAVL